MKPGSLPSSRVQSDFVQFEAGGPSNAVGAHSFASFANEWALRATVVSKGFHRTHLDLPSATSGGGHRTDRI
jgi:uncharacterized protein YodC (DUF2158 family)